MWAVGTAQGYYETSDVVSCCTTFEDTYGLGSGYRLNESFVLFVWARTVFQWGGLG